MKILLASLIVVLNSSFLVAMTEGEVEAGVEMIENALPLAGDGRLSVATSQGEIEARIGFERSAAYQQAAAIDNQYGHLLSPRQADLTAADFMEETRTLSSEELDDLRKEWENYLKQDAEETEARKNQILMYLQQADAQVQYFQGKCASSRLRTASSEGVEPAVVDQKRLEECYAPLQQESQQATARYQEWMAIKTSDSECSRKPSLQPQELKNSALKQLEAARQGIQDLRKAEETIQTAGLPKQYYLRPDLAEREEIRIASEKIQAAKSACQVAEEKYSIAEDAFQAAAQWVAVVEKQRRLLMSNKGHSLGNTQEFKVQEEAINQEILSAFQVAFKARHYREELAEMKANIMAQKSSLVSHKLTLDHSARYQQSSLVRK